MGQVDGRGYFLPQDDEVLDEPRLRRALEEIQIRLDTRDEAVDKAVAPVALVTALPSAPANGTTVDYQSAAMAVDGVRWRLTYNAQSASAYKWEFVGGTPLFSEVATSESTTSGTYVDLATVGPSVTTPLAGDYDVTIEAVAASSAVSSFAGMSYAIGGTAATDADYAHVNSQVANQEIVATRTRRKTGLPASTALVAKYRTSASASYHSRMMRVIPVRVG